MRKPFEGIFGNTPELRMLEFLLPLEGIDFNISELAEEVGISRPTAQKIVKKFLNYGILKIFSERGGVKYYEINPESPFVRLIEEINNVLIAEMMGPEIMQKVEQMWRKRKQEEINKLVYGMIKEIRELFVSADEEIPTPATLIEEEESLVNPSIQPSGVYVSPKTSTSTDLLRVSGGDLNAA